MNPVRRREMVDREHPSLPIVGQCALLGVSRSSIYYRPKGASEEDLSLMREIDRQYLATPFYGSRRMQAWLNRQGFPVSRKRVQRLMRDMGLPAQPLILLQQPQVLHAFPARQVRQHQRYHHLGAGLTLAALIDAQVAADRFSQPGSLPQFQVSPETGHSGHPGELRSSAYWKGNAPWFIMVVPRG